MPRQLLQSLRLPFFGILIDDSVIPFIWNACVLPDGVEQYFKMTAARIGSVLDSSTFTL